MDTVKFKEGEKEKLSLDKFMMLGLDQDKDDIKQSEDQSTQATPEIRENDTQTHLREDIGN